MEPRRCIGLSSRRYHILFIISITTMLMPLSAHACEDWVAKVVAVEGAVQHKHGQQDWQPLQREQHICPGGSVKVGDNSRASLHLRNNTFTRLDADSLLSFPVQTQERRFWIELRQGLAHFISRIVHEFEVSTPYVNAVVEGTEFVVAAQQGQGAVSVMEGKVTAYNEKSRASLTAGQQAVSGGRDLDLSRFNVPADTLVEWAIHYPPVLSLAELPAQTAQDKAVLQQAITALQQNRVDQALQILEDAPVSDIVQLARGTLLLQIGRMPEFTRTIEPLLQGPTSGLAHGLKSIAAIARNDIASGRASADIAVQRAPNSAAAWIALSYAQQAELQLNAALESARKATQVQPTSLLAHLRLSELHLAQGDVDAARDALEAVPDDVARGAELEGSKGFVQLFRLKLDSAREHFNRALAMDSSNPQYQLGLGLTLLRDGDLKAGRQHMEYAVSLDPLRSVLRSYLGRAYFEEKRDDIALEQWQLAKQFDPNDPTPYFYTGVHKLFANDPIGAVEELETSRDLNDKRAIYRSETLLQSDAASRSATLARAYGEVGYDQGVLLSGWDALRRDPTNSEGHRLLADYYAGDPRYETARVSELLQSQLWQPLSAYPLQPQLSEANLAVVAGAGPQRPGFNEYHSLFTQDGAYGMVNGYGGSDGTWGNDLVGSVLAGPVALSLGQYHYESNGWRENADQEQDIYNGLVQWQVGPSTNVQLEARKAHQKNGDLGVLLNNEPDDSFRGNFERLTYRASLTHEINNQNAVVISAMTQELEERQNLVPELDAEFVAGYEASPDSVEVQYVLKLPKLKFLFGAGQFQDDQVQNTDATTAGILYLMQNAQHNLYHNNAYLYGTYDVFQSLEVTLGVAYDEASIEGQTYTEFFGMADTTELDQDEANWSPKVGVQLQLSQQWVLRGAFFKTFKRDLSSLQTIEPTHVTGFSQFYDDVNRAEATTYAFAFDGSLSDSTLMGVEVVKRSVHYPLFSVGDISKLKNEERRAGVYLTQLLWRNISLNARYVLDKFEFEQPDNTVDELRNLRGQRVPLSLNWFAGNALHIGARITYFDQAGAIYRIDPVAFEPFFEKIDHEVWIGDIYASMLLPSRFGEVRVGVDNVSDRNTKLLSTNLNGLAYYPGRFFYGSIRFAF